MIALIVVCMLISAVIFALPGVRAHASRHPHALPHVRHPVRFPPQNPPKGAA